MKFKCEKCSTRYTIADEKIRRKVLKIRCKICEHVIIVRDPGAAGTAATTPSPRIAGGIFQTHGSISGDVEDRTVITDPLGSLLDVEWYAAPGGEQIGPMPFERLRDKIKRAEITGDDVVWNETMGDWTAVRDVPELAQLLRDRHPPPPPLPSSVRRPPPPPSGSIGPDMGLLAPSSPATPAAGLGLDLSATPSVGAGFGLDLSAPPAATEARPVEQLSAGPLPLEPLFGSGFFDDVTAPGPTSEDTEAFPVIGPPADEPHQPFFPEQVSGEQATPAVAAASARAVDGAAAPAAVVPPSTPAAAPAPTHAVLRTSELQALTRPPKRSIAPIAIGVVLLGAGVGLGIMLAPGGGPPPAGDSPPISAAGAGAAVQPVVSPAPEPVAGPNAKPVARTAPEPVVVPDAAVALVSPDAGATAVAANEVDKPRPRPAGVGIAKPSPPPPPPSSESKKPVGRFGALDRGKTQVAVVAPSVPVSDALPDTITQGQILSVIKRHQRGVRSCYERQLKRDDSLRSAKIMLKFSIQGSGRTSNVRLARRFDGTVLKTCLTALVGRWRFPRFSGEAIPVEYPLVLQASL